MAVAIGGGAAVASAAVEAGVLGLTAEAPADRRNVGRDGGAGSGGTGTVDTGAGAAGAGETGAGEVRPGTAACTAAAWANAAVTAA
jgi:hypothetical protein